MWANGGTVRLSINVAAMATKSDSSLADIDAKYQYWNTVLHEMHLLQPDKHLRDQAPARPVVLILGPIVQARVIIHLWLGSVPFLADSTQPIMRVFPEVSGNGSVSSDQTPFADCYIVPDLSRLSAESVHEFQNIFRDAQILVNISADRALLKSLLYNCGEDDGPLLYLESQHLASSQSPSPIPTESTTIVWKHHVPLDSTESAAAYLQQLPQLWPCFLAQLLERHLQSVMQGTVPRLQRWRRRWLLSVGFVDLLVFAGVVWIIMQWGWWNVLLHMPWTTLPALLAMATLFVAVFVILISLLVLWRIHKGTCALCSMAFLSCLGASGNALRKPLRSAFRKNTRDFWQALSCRDLCGWSHEQRNEAVSFCQYCDQLKSRLLTTSRPSHEKVF